MVLFLSKEERLCFKAGTLSSLEKNVPDFLNSTFGNRSLELVARGLLLVGFAYLLLSNAFTALSLAIVVIRCFLLFSLRSSPSKVPLLVALRSFRASSKGGSSFTPSASEFTLSLSVVSLPLVLRDS